MPSSPECWRNPRSGSSAASVTSPLENLCGPGQPLRKEAPDAKELAGLERSGLRRLAASTSPTMLHTRCALRRCAAWGIARRGEYEGDLYVDERPPSPLQSRRLTTRGIPGDVVSNPKLRRPSASASSRLNIRRPAVTAAASDRGRPRASTSASTNSDTPRTSTSSWLAIVDLPAPFGPARTTTEGCSRCLTAPYGRCRRRVTKSERPAS